jgi:hypothetical protein
LDNPDVIHTFSAGCTCHFSSFGIMLFDNGMLLNRVIITPLVSACNFYRG